MTVRNLLNHTGGIPDCFDVTDSAKGGDVVTFDGLNGDEVFMRDGDLYAKAIDDDGGKPGFRLYPIGENEFGRKDGMLKLTFGKGCLMFVDYVCKKL